jgi:hypothetical protein
VALELAPGEGNLHLGLRTVVPNFGEGASVPGLGCRKQRKCKDRKTACASAHRARGGRRCWPQGTPWKHRRPRGGGRCDGLAEELRPEPRRGPGLVRCSKRLILHALGFTCRRQAPQSIAAAPATISAGDSSAWPWL